MAGQPLTTTVFLMPETTIIAMAHSPKHFVMPSNMAGKHRRNVNGMLEGCLILNTVAWAEVRAKTVSNKYLLIMSSLQALTLGA